MHILKLPNEEYINLAFVRRVQVEDTEEGSIVAIHWQGGGSQVYRNENAKAVIDILDAHSLTIDQQAVAIAREIFTTFNLNSSI